jgi:hypothetical protein
MTELVVHPVRNVAAFKVVVPVTDTGPEYAVELPVGVVPSVV